MLQLLLGLPFWQWPVPSTPSLTVVNAAPLTGVWAAAIAPPPATSRLAMSAADDSVVRNLRSIERYSFLRTLDAEEEASATSPRSRARISRRNYGGRESPGKRWSAVRAEELVGVSTNATSTAHS